MTVNVEGPVLVLGGSGFLGRRLVGRLRARGATAIVLDRGPLAGDGFVSTSSPGWEEAVASCEPRIVVNLAAAWRAAGASPAQEVAANLAVPARVLALLLESDGFRDSGSWIQAGSYFELERAQSGRHKDLYSACRTGVADVLELVGDVTGVRPATVYLPHLLGRGAPAGRLVPSLVASLRAGEEFAMTSGVQRIPVLHVDDAAECLIAILLDPTARGRFGATPAWYGTVRELAVAVAERMNRASLLQVGVRPLPLDTVVNGVDFPAPPDGWVSGLSFGAILDEVCDD